MPMRTRSTRGRRTAREMKIAHSKTTGCSAGDFMVIQDGAEVREDARPRPGVPAFLLLRSSARTTVQLAFRVSGANECIMTFSVGTPVREVKCALLRKIKSSNFRGESAMGRRPHHHLQDLNERHTKLIHQGKIMSDASVLGEYTLPSHRKHQVLALLRPGYHLGTSTPATLQQPACRAAIPAAMGPTAAVAAAAAAAGPGADTCNTHPASSGAAAWPLGQTPLLPLGLVEASGKGGGATDWTAAAAAAAAVASASTIANAIQALGRACSRHVAVARRSRPRQAKGVARFAGRRARAAIIGVEPLWAPRRKRAEEEGGGAVTGAGRSSRAVRPAQLHLVPGTST